MMKSIVSLLFVLIAVMLFTGQVQAGYADGMNRYAGYHVMHDALDPMGTKIVAKCEVAEWLIESKRVDAFDMQQIGDKDLYVYSGNATYSQGWVESEILGKMIRSDHEFRVLEGTIENLQEHVDVRLKIIENASNKQILFGAGQDWTVHHTTNPPPVWLDDPQAFYESVNNPLTCLACNDVTTMVLQGATGGKKLEVRSRSIWIPGDAGYIENTNFNPNTWDAGYEGENIIYVGDDMFWGHISNNNDYKRLDGPTNDFWTGLISNWTSSDGTQQGKALVQKDVKYPGNGLDNGN